MRQLGLGSGLIFIFTRRALQTREELAEVVSQGKTALEGLILLNAMNVEKKKS